MYGCPRDGERQALTQALVFLGRHAGGYDNSNGGLLNEAARVLEETVFLSSPESPITGEVSNQALENTGDPMIHLPHMKKVRPLKYGFFLHMLPTEMLHPTRGEETEKRETG